MNKTRMTYCYVEGDESLRIIKDTWCVNEEWARSTHDTRHCPHLLHLRHVVLFDTIRESENQRSGVIKNFVKKRVHPSSRISHWPNVGRSRGRWPGQPPGQKLRLSNKAFRPIDSPWPRGRHMSGAGRIPDRLVLWPKSPWRCDSGIFGWTSPHPLSRPSSASSGGKSHPLTFPHFRRGFPTMTSSRDSRCNYPWFRGVRSIFFLLFLSQFYVTHNLGGNRSVADFFANTVFFGGRGPAIKGYPPLFVLAKGFHKRPKSKSQSACGVSWSMCPQGFSSRLQNPDRDAPTFGTLDAAHLIY